MSMILPLPSSPHCAPTTTLIDITINRPPLLDLKFDQFGIQDVLGSLNFLHHVVWDGIIYLEKGPRLAARFVAAQGHPGNVDMIIAQESPDLPHDAGHIAVGNQKAVALRGRLDVKIIDHDDT